jgi:hypothetical protein
MQVSTYCRRKFVKANCVCAKVKTGCSSFATFTRLGAMRASSWVVASVLSPSEVVAHRRQ